jgi:glycosyltransferase involved in cell wall biosynthesis
MPRAVMGLLFYPRGGAAQVTRSLARHLPAHGWDVTIVSGSLGHGGLTDAQRFFEGLELRAVDYTEAAAAPDPLRADPPMHPSYEDREGAPDRVFARVDDEGYERLVTAWARELEAAGAADADVLHLNHLTPLNEAAARVAPGVPVVGHVHGTELLMLEEIAAGPPEGWEHAAAWAERMREWAHGCRRILLLSATQASRMEAMLGIAPERCTVVANGYDPATFHPREIDRPAHWRRHLVEQPRGWRPGGEPGSVAYAPEDLVALTEGTVLLYVGRYTAVKRIDLLIRAHARARERYRSRAGLVLLGGFPDEWEGEHPLETIEATGARDVFLAGWHEHPELPGFLAASDVVVLPSVREQFGQVIVEGMACGLPAIAVNAYGPAEIVQDGETGWLVPPDDEEALCAALIEAVDDAGERRRRGEAARAVAAERYSWPALAGQVADVYRDATGLVGPAR